MTERSEQTFITSLNSLCQASVKAARDGQREYLNKNKETYDREGEVCQSCRKIEYFGNVVHSSA